MSFIALSTAAPDRASSGPSRDWSWPDTASFLSTEPTTRSHAASYRSTFFELPLRGAGRLVVSCRGAVLSVEAPGRKYVSGHVVGRDWRSAAYRWFQIRPHLRRGWCADGAYPLAATQAARRVSSRFHPLADALVRWSVPAHQPQDTDRDAGLRRGFGQDHVSDSRRDRGVVPHFSAGACVREVRS